MRFRRKQAPSILLTQLSGSGPSWLQEGTGRYRVPNTLGFPAIQICTSAQQAHPAQLIAPTSNLCATCQQTPRHKLPGSATSPCRGQRECSPWEVTGGNQTQLVHPVPSREAPGSRAVKLGGGGGLIDLEVEVGVVRWGGLVFKVACS